MLLDLNGQTHLLLDLNGQVHLLLTGKYEAKASSKTSPYEAPSGVESFTSGPSVSSGKPRMSGGVGPSSTAAPVAMAVARSVKIS